MKKKMLVLAALTIIVLTTACTTFNLSGVQINEEMTSYKAVAEFETTVMVNEFLGSPGGMNLFNATARAMDNPIYDSLRREIHKYSGDAAVNITVQYKATFIDILLSVMTWGIYTPAHADIKGTIVKYQ